VGWSSASRLERIGAFLDGVPIVELEKSHIVQVRGHLDTLARKGELHPKSCLNIWSVLTKAMREAVPSKLPGMQVRATSPCSEVQAPDRGESRTRPWLTPKEIYQLLACTSVSLAHRQLYAVAAYTYCRPGEVAGTTFADIDLDLGVIYVRRALNWDTRETKRPKTRSGRRIVPIHPNLAPLLQAMPQDENTPLWPDLSEWKSDRGGSMPKSAINIWSVLTKAKPVVENDQWMRSRAYDVDSQHWRNSSMRSRRASPPQHSSCIRR
jgi:integrase